MSTKTVILNTTVMDRDANGDTHYYTASEKPQALPVALANELIKKKLATPTKTKPDADDQNPDA